MTDEMLEIMLIKGVILFFAIILVYIPAMDGGYIYDDDQLLTMNPIIQRGHGFLDKESWYGLGSFWFPKEARGAADYFPLTSSTLWLEWRLFGNNEPRTPLADRGIGAPGYHIVNVVLHAFCVVLLWAVLARISIPGAWIAAFIWGIHPVCVESVAWISELKNTLSMVIFLPMMLAWFRYQRTRMRRDYVLTIVLFIAALLAKTAIVMAPFILLLYIWWDRGLEDGKKWWGKVTVDDLIESIPFFAISFVFGLITMWFQVTRAIGQEIVPIGSYFERFAGACFALGFYLYKIILPVNLVLIYPEWHIAPEGHFMSHELLLILPGIAYAGVFFWAWQNRTSWGRHVIFSLGFFVLMLFPILGLVKIAYLRLTLVADHFEYMPMVSVIALIVAAVLRVRSSIHVPAKAVSLVAFVGIFGLVGMYVWYLSMVIPLLLGMRQLYSLDLGILTLVAIYGLMIAVWLIASTWLVYFYENPVKAVLDITSMMILSMFCVLTWQRAYAFSDKKALWMDTLAKNPHSWQAHSHYGAILYTEGDIDGALEHWTKCVELKPYIYEVHNNKGLALMAKGCMEEALAEYKAAVDIDSTQFPVVMNYADGLRIAKHYGEAIEQYKKLLKLAGEHPSPVVFLDMGVSYFEMGRLDDSIEAFENALRIEPKYEDARRDLDRVLQAKQAELQQKRDEANRVLQAKPPVMEKPEVAGTSTSGTVARPAATPSKR